MVRRLGGHETASWTIIYGSLLFPTIATARKKAVEEIRATTTRDSFSPSIGFPKGLTIAAL